MWQDLISKSQQEQNFWRAIEQSGKRYEGAEQAFKTLRENNTQYLYVLAKRDGWPSISKYGAAINEAANCIARASIATPVAMRFFATLLSASAQTNESKPIHAAALLDCIAYYEGRPQVCGLFLEWQPSGELYANVTSIDEANSRRSELGLPSLTQAINDHLALLESNPGSKPQDINAHNKMHRAWAKSVGWV